MKNGYSPRLFKVVLPKKSATAKIVKILDPDQSTSPSRLPPKRLSNVIKKLDHVQYLDKSTRRRSAKRKNSKKSNANKQRPRGTGRADRDMVPDNNHGESSMDGDGNRTVGCEASNVQRSPCIGVGKSRPGLERKSGDKGDHPNCT